MNSYCPLTQTRRRCAPDRVYQNSIAVDSVLFMLTGNQLVPSDAAKMHSLTFACVSMCNFGLYGPDSV